MKNALPIFGGVVGAVTGFVATLLVLELGGFGNKADPITSGLLALAVLAAAGAIAGLVLGTGFTMRLRGRNDTGGLLANSRFSGRIARCKCKFVTRMATRSASASTAV